jgi:ABC-type nitrate/sulfonate/bicarbonate transport system permease component
MLKKLFTPFSYVDKKTLTMVGVFQLSLLILAWLFLVPEKTLFPHFGEVIDGWKQLWNNGFFYEILASLKLCLIATVISVIVSSIIAYATTIPFFKPLGNFFTKLRYNPIQGFTLFLTQISGGGRNLQITLLVIFMSFYFIDSLIVMIKAIPEEDIIRRKAQKMSSWKVLWKVVIQDRLDYLFEIVRQNLSITFMMLVSVEAMNKAAGGMGAILNDTNRALNFPKIFAIQITILIVGVLIDTALRFIINQFPANRNKK